MKIQKNLGTLSKQTQNRHNSSMDTQIFAGQHFVIAADHGGFALKEHLIGYFNSKNITSYTDIGVFSADKADFPAQAADVVRAIHNKDAVWGILICGAGLGMTIAANRHKGIYCTPCHDTTTARLARQHNNANVLALGGRLLGPTLAEDIVEIFMNTAFLGGHYQDRVNMIDPGLNC